MAYGCAGSTPAIGTKLRFCLASFKQEQTKSKCESKLETSKEEFENKKYEKLKQRAFHEVEYGLKYYESLIQASTLYKQ